MNPRLQRLAYGIFGRLPKKVRHRVIRVLTPTFSAGASAFLEDDDGRVLLVLHPYRNRWSPPGGLLDRNEQPAVAAVREMAEEVGVTVEVIEHCGAAVQLPRRHIDFVFRVRLVAGSDQPRPASPEITEIAWFAPDTFPELDPETRETLVVAGYLPSSD